MPLSELCLCTLVSAPCLVSSWCNCWSLTGTRKSQHITPLLSSLLWVPFKVFKLWSSLPLHIGPASSLAIFKFAPKTHLLCSASSQFFSSFIKYFIIMYLFLCLALQTVVVVFKVLYKQSWLVHQIKTKEMPLLGNTMWVRFTSSTRLFLTFILSSAATM